MTEKEICVGMEVLVKGHGSRDEKGKFFITEITAGVVTVSGLFTTGLNCKQHAYVPISDFLTEDFSNSVFRLKDGPKYDEDILVSDDNKNWRIRSFKGYSSDIDYSVITRACAEDDFTYDSNNDSQEDEFYWKFFKRFAIIK